MGYGRGEYNLNTEGEKLFLNAIEYMLGTLQRLKASSPIPTDGALHTDTWANLNWSVGDTAVSHDVYFGDNFNDVNDGTAETFIGNQTLTFFVVGFPGFAFPDGLVPGTTYYWRVDEVEADGATKHKGDVWSFTTIRPGGGIRAQYYRGGGLSGSPVINTKDANINFNWAADSPDTILDAESFSVRWTGELEVEFSEAYTFYANTDDGVRLWVNDQLIIDRWVDRRAPTEAKGTVELTGGQRTPFVMEYYESGGDAVAELRWESPSLPKQVIPDAAFSLPVKASGANPSTGAVDVTQTPVLEWGAGDFAASHEVYFGTDGDAVKNADASSAQYKGSRNLGSESYDPGQLEWNTTYYWRVDEVNNTNADSPWTGNVWSFTTANFLIVDDMESYNDINEG